MAYTASIRTNNYGKKEMNNLKRTKKLLTILLATVFALSLVPTGAWADSTTSVDAGHFGTTGGTQGKITISDAEDGETYSLYKILDLASFSDTQKGAGQHDTEAYSYVIES
ncbi:MAG: hypothetical protein J6S63_08600, partial [Atopobiaceae bacterium]|nr:hypothetical protein [Atopobiaceae bacterium]